MVAAIFMWENPIQSGLIFGSLNLLFLLVVWLDFSVIAIACYLFFSLSLIGVAVNYLGKDDQQTDEDDYEYIDRETFKNILVFIEAQIFKLTGTFSDIQLIQSFCACIVLYYLGMLFSFASLLWIASILAFTVPMGYMMN